MRDDQHPQLQPAGDVAIPLARTADDRGSDRLTGILVHRLLQRADLVANVSDEHLRLTAAAILRATPSAELEDIEGLLDAVVRKFRRVSLQDDVRELYRAGRPHHEVPFSMQIGGEIVRGTIDCLIAAADRVTVLEFKTGRARQEHEAQLEVYRAAAQALFPGVPVESRLVYTSDSAVV